MIHLKEAVEDLDLCFLVETSSSANEVNSNFRSLAKENIQKIISVLHPQFKRTLLDCLRKNNILSHISGEEGGSKIWYAKYLDSLYPRPGSPRRRLGSESPQSIAATPSPAPAVGSLPFSPTSSPDPAPSPATVPSSPPESNPQHPASQDSNQDSSASPDSNPIVQENKKSNSNKSVVIAVAVTASVTFVVAALLFICFSKVCRKGSGLRRNDERPLLGISFSEFSVGIYSYIRVSYTF